MASYPKIFFTAQSQAFSIVVNGLVPLTRHFVYFERQKMADASCAPLGGSVGQALVSDLNGKLQFTLYYGTGLNTEVNSLQAATALANSIAGVKEVIIANINVAQLDETTYQSVFSKSRTLIQVQVLLPTQAELTTYVNVYTGITQGR